MQCCDCGALICENDEFLITKEEAIQLLDFIRQSGYISYEFHPLISPLADKIRDHYKEKK